MTGSGRAIHSAGVRLRPGFGRHVYVHCMYDVQDLPMYCAVRTVLYTVRSTVPTVGMCIRSPYGIYIYIYNMHERVSSSLLLVDRSIE